MGPHPEAEEGDGGAGEHHRRVPNSGLRENVGRISETIPMAGRIRMYTSG